MLRTLRATTLPLRAVNQTAVFRSSSSLVKTIHAEIKHDLDSGSAEMPQELIDLKSAIEKRLKVVDTQGMAAVQLVSDKLTIEFDIRDIAGDMFDTGGEEGEDEEEMPQLPFSADIKKGEDILRFRCTAAETVMIDSVEFLKDGGSETGEEYSGPIFEELDGELQNGLNTYLADHGVDETVASFITMYADFKEQQEYTHWLTNVANFVKAK